MESKYRFPNVSRIVIVHLIVMKCQTNLCQHDIAFLGCDTISFHCVSPVPIEYMYGPVFVFPMTRFVPLLYAHTISTKFIRSIMAFSISNTNDSLNTGDKSDDLFNKVFLDLITLLFRIKLTLTDIPNRGKSDEIIILL